MDLVSLHAKLENRNLNYLFFKSVVFVVFLLSGFCSYRCGQLVGLTRDFLKCLEPQKHKEKEEKNILLALEDWLCFEALL